MVHPPPNPRKQLDPISRRCADLPTVPRSATVTGGTGIGRRSPGLPWVTGRTPGHRGPPPHLGRAPRKAKPCRRCSTPSPCRT
jgi:hypothetical protein